MKFMKKQKKMRYNKLNKGLRMIDWKKIKEDLIYFLKSEVEKSGLKKVTVGLSGGLDSAVVAALAVKALGPGNVQGYMMPSKFTSQQSIDDAKALALNLGISCDIIPIEACVAALNEGISSISCDLNELTAQNIQARARGLILMGISNNTGSLLLNTSNKSELAVGYCTLYGDMCGALAPIADLFKTNVYKLAEYLNQSVEVIPRSIIQRPPTAELQFNQTDQDTLPDYEVLDGILALYIERNASIAEIVPAGFDPELVRRVVSMVHVNEYKRKQSPPILKLTPAAFGYGWRYLITANML